MSVRMYEPYGSSLFFHVGFVPQYTRFWSQNSSTTGSLLFGTSFSWSRSSFVFARHWTQTSTFPHTDSQYSGLTSHQIKLTTWPPLVSSSFSLRTLHSSHIKHFTQFPVQFFNPLEKDYIPLPTSRLYHSKRPDNSSYLLSRFWLRPLSHFSW